MTELPAWLAPPATLHLLNPQDNTFAQYHTKHHDTLHNELMFRFAQWNFCNIRHNQTDLRAAYQPPVDWTFDTCIIPGLYKRVKFQLFIFVQYSSTKQAVTSASKAAGIDPMQDSHILGVSLPMLF